MALFSDFIELREGGGGGIWFDDRRMLTNIIIPNLKQAAMSFGHGTQPLKPVGHKTVNGI